MNIMYDSILLSMLSSTQLRIIECALNILMVRKARLSLCISASNLWICFHHSYVIIAVI